MENLFPLTNDSIGDMHSGANIIALALRSSHHSNNNYEELKSACLNFANNFSIIKIDPKYIYLIEFNTIISKLISAWDHDLPDDNLKSAISLWLNKIEAHAEEVDRHERHQRKLSTNDQYISCAAILQNGVICSLPRPARHHDIIRAMAEAGYKLPIKGQQGFLASNDGLFLTREDAGLLLDFPEENGYYKKVYSEDLW